MIGVWSDWAQPYLLVIVAVTSVVFALPIFLVPLRWAAAFQWRLPADTDLAVYFGRCLGAFVLIVEALMLRAGLTGEGLEFTFQVILAVSLMMTIVHVWGWAQKIQPWTENAEILMYSGLGVVTLAFYPVGT